MDRILLVMAAQEGREASEALRSALASADAPGSLSVGLLTDSVRGLPAMETVAALRTAPYADPWREGIGLWEGETWILLGAPEMRFERHWDRFLLRQAARWETRSQMGPVFTGCLPAEADAIHAVSPVAAARFDWQGRLEQTPGVPLRYAVESEPGALIHPRFCFAKAGFFRAAAAADCDPFWTAFRGRWAVMTLSRPVIRLTRDDPLPTVLAPAEDRDGRQRFARHFGIDFDRQTLSPQAAEGVWNPELAAPAKVPLRVRVQEGLRSLDNVRSKLTPLAVTCRLGMPEREDAEAVELARFRRLASLRNVPLLCFADRVSRSRTEKLCPRTAEYQPRYAMPTALPLDNRDKALYLRLSAPFLLAAAREMENGHSHYVWMDADVLRYPVYARAAVDWQVICGDRVTLARVDGRPDLSCFTVPEPLVLGLCRDVQRICAGTVRETEALPPAEEVWEALIAADPDRFEVVDLPAPRELFGLTMVNKEEEW